jgi:hypothetical protein
VIQCPNCKQTLPDWQQTCQFCKADTKAVARPVKQRYAKSDQAFAVPKWVWTAYYGIAGYWIIESIFTILTTLNTISENAAKAAAAKNEIEKMILEPSIWSYLPIAFAGITILFAIGLMIRNNTIRGIVNFFSAIKLLAGVCGIVGTLLAGMVFGPWALLYLIVHLITIGTAAMMIYLIGETDKVSY